MRLRTAIALTMSLALAVALAVTGLIVSRVLERAARRELESELARGRGVFEDLLLYRKTLHRAESRVLADEPRLKAVVATDDVTAATVLGVIADLRRALRCDLLLIIDRGGRLLASATHPEEAGAVLAENPTVATALEHGESDGVWIDGAQVFQVHGRRLSYGTMSVGAVVVGYRIDDALAETVARQMGVHVIIANREQPIAASHLLPDVTSERAIQSAVLAAAAPGPAGSQGSEHQGEHASREVRVAGGRYILTSAALPGYGGGEPLRYAIYRSLDQALAPARRLVRILYGVTASALVLALAAAVWLARRLAQPVDELAAFAQRIAHGDLEHPVQITGLLEVRALAGSMNQMVREIAASRTQLAEKARLSRELEIAQRIQTSILPRNVKVPGLTLAAQMVPASEVGGDYYDVIPLPDGCWLAIGDVAGHGLPAGMVMFMVQSAFGALVRSRPDAAPRQVAVLLNQILVENVRNRLDSDEHVTFTAARYFTDGRIVFAGAHEPIIVLRAATGACELVPTPGTWLGIIDHIDHATTDSTLSLQPGDLAVLYSDGVTEAMSEQKEQLGIDRLCAEITKCRGQTPESVHAHLMDLVRGWSKVPDDDFTLLVLRHEGLPSGASHQQGAGSREEHGT
ncbi:MAG: SpoIIE family protein phosphatase [Polyangia bacterium]